MEAGISELGAGEVPCMWCCKAADRERGRRSFTARARAEQAAKLGKHRGAFPCLSLTRSPGCAEILPAITAP